MRVDASTVFKHECTKASPLSDPTTLLLWSGCHFNKKKVNNSLNLQQILLKTSPCVDECKMFPKIYSFYRFSVKTFIKSGVSGEEVVA